MSDAEKEREQIIKYLRECQRRHEENLSAENGRYKTASKHHADACKYASQAIENGEHWENDL